MRSRRCNPSWRMVVFRHNIPNLTPAGGGYSVRSRGIGVDLEMERRLILVEDSEKLSERAAELLECWC